MSDLVKISVTGERQAGIRFDAFPDDLYGDLNREITALSGELFARVQALTPKRTGQLLSEERLRIFADKNRITGYVDIAGAKGSQAFAKAGAEEYGAHRSHRVRSHTMRLDHHWAVRLAQPETVMVEAFTRTANIAEVAFERGPLAQMRPEVVARLNAVVEKRVAEANA